MNTMISLTQTEDRALQHGLQTSAVFVVMHVAVAKLAAAERPAWLRSTNSSEHSSPGLDLKCWLSPELIDMSTMPVQSEQLQCLGHLNVVSGEPCMKGIIAAGSICASPRGEPSGDQQLSNYNHNVALTGVLGQYLGSTICWGTAGGGTPAV